MLSISKEEIVSRLYFDNPWWENMGVDQRYKDFPRRFYFEPFFKLIKESSINRAAVLMGPRRVGKTVMVYHAVDRLLEEGVPTKNIFYVSLETPIYTGLSLEQLVNMLQKEFSHRRDAELYIIFDEIQYLPNWEVHLKSLVDSYPSYKYIATGSAAAALKLKSRESGAGRFTEFLLPPLTFAEYISFIGKVDSLIIRSDSDWYEPKDTNNLNEEFVNYLNYGGYPEAVFSSLVQKESSRYIKNDIIDKVLLRDLPSLYGIKDVQELNKLFNSIAYNTGNEITLESLSKSSGVSKNTIKKYMVYLEAAFLIKIVYRVDITAKKFKRATTFKVYLTNPSMRAALFGPIYAKHEAMGSLTETAIFSQWFHSQNIDNLHYARWKSGEVDIVWLDAEQKPNWCVEVKWSDLPCSDSRIVKGITEFAQKNNLKTALVTTKTLTQKGTINNVDIRFIPSASYAYTLSANILSDERMDMKVLGSINKLT